MAPARLLPLPNPFFSFTPFLLPAGFPSPAGDYLEDTIDVNELLQLNHASVYMLRAEGESMQGVGIFSGDLLIVDRSKKAQAGDVVVAYLDGEYTCKILRGSLPQRIYLEAANQKYLPIHPGPEADFRIFGVVTNVIHHLHGKSNRPG